jgi:hypothetical protein
MHMKALLGLLALIVGGLLLSFVGSWTIWFVTIWWPIWLWQLMAWLILAMIAFAVLQPLWRR